MKKIFTILLLVCLVMLNSCGKTNEQPKIKVTDIKVTEYQKNVIEGNMFDEASVFVDVTFSDGTKKVYCDNDITFDYQNFDSSTPGMYRIKATINDIDVSFEIAVEVVKKVFKVLMIGNSYADDTVQWIHEICDDLNIEFTIANLYIGGCTLATHLNNLKYDKKAYEYVSYNKITKTWSRQKNTSIEDALSYDDWNYISLQQASHHSGYADTYDDINEIMDYVLAFKEDVKFIWNMTWAYEQDSNHTNFGNYDNDQLQMYEAIINSVKEKVLPNDLFSCIVPNGTAIQNARTSFVGDNLCRDSYCHLTLDFGRYIAGLTFVYSLTKVDIDNVNYAPMNLKDEYILVAKEAAKNAVLNPYVITESIYK